MSCLLDTCTILSRHFVNLYLTPFLSAAQLMELGQYFLVLLALEKELRYVLCTSVSILLSNLVNS